MQRVVLAKITFAKEGAAVPNPVVVAVQPAPHAQHGLQAAREHGHVRVGRASIVDAWDEHLAVLALNELLLLRRAEHGLV